MNWRDVAYKLLEQERQENAERDKEKQQELAEIQIRRKTILRVCAELDVAGKLAEIGTEFWGSCTINTDFPENLYPSLLIKAVSPVYYFYEPGYSRWGRDGLDSWPSKVVGSTDVIMVEIRVRPHTSEEPVSVTVYGASGKSKPGHSFYLTNFSAITEDDKRRLDECLSKVCLEASKFVTKVEECKQVVLNKVLRGEFSREALPVEFELPPEVLIILQEREEEERKNKEEAALALAAQKKKNSFLSFFGL